MAYVVWSINANSSEEVNSKTGGRDAKFHQSIGPSQIQYFCS